MDFEKLRKKVPEALTVFEAKKERKERKGFVPVCSLSSTR